MGSSVLVSIFRQVIKALCHICCTEAGNGRIFIVIAAVMVLFCLFQQKTSLPVPKIWKHFCQDTAGYIAEQIGKLLDVPVLPTIPFGRSVIHRDFPGTIYITDETYEHYLRDVFSAIRENAI